MTSTQHPVLLFGAGLTVLGAMRLLHEAGFAPLVATDPGDVARRSRWYQPAPPSRGGADPAKDLLAYLDGLPLEGAALLPCADSWTMRVAEIAPRLGNRFASSVAPLGALDRLVDKWHLAEVMREAGLPHPCTVPIDSHTDLGTLPDTMLAGAFIKPRDSLGFFARFGVKAFRVASRAEIAARMREIAPFEFAVQVQQYIPGPPENHFFVDGFVDRAGRIPGLFVRRRLRMSPPDFGNSTLMESVPPTDVPDAVDTVTRLLAHVGYRGVFSAELKRDPRDGICRLIEVNVRPWWFVEFAGQCGVNVCDMAVRDALGESIAPVRGYALNRRCVYPYYDLDACRALRREGRLSIPAWFASWATATQPVFRWSDPWPAVAESALLVGRRLSRRGLHRNGGVSA